MQKTISKANFGRGQYCGYLKKMGSVNKSWKERFFVLDDEYLSYFTNEDSQNSLGKINLSNSYVKHSNQEGGIEVVTEGRVYVLLANSNQEAEIWVNHLRPCSQIYAENEIIRKADQYLRDLEREKCAPNKKKDKFIKKEISKMVQLNDNIGSNPNSPFLMNSVVPQEIHDSYKCQQNKKSK
eukprot:gene6374-10381_t